MKVFTEDEVKKLISEKRISAKDVTRLISTAQKAGEDDVEDKQKTSKSDPLPDILQALQRLIMLEERELEKPEGQTVVQAAAPVVNVALPEEEPETMKRWNFTVQRDSKGFIASVDAQQVA